MVMIVVIMIVVIVIVIVVVAVITLVMNREFGGGHTGPKHLSDGDRGAVNRQAAERGAQLLEREPRVDERAQDHVARRAGETIEIQDT